jgi:hypothetical protein
MPKKFYAYLRILQAKDTVSPILIIPYACTLGIMMCDLSQEANDRKRKG